MMSDFGTISNKEVFLRIRGAALSNIPKASLQAISRLFKITLLCLAPC